MEVAIELPEEYETMEISVPGDVQRLVPICKEQWDEIIHLFDGKNFLGKC